MDRKGRHFKDRKVTFTNAKAGSIHRILRLNLLRAMLFLILMHAQERKGECVRWRMKYISSPSIYPLLQDSISEKLAINSNNDSLSFLAQLERQPPAARGSDIWRRLGHPKKVRWGQCSSKQHLSVLRCSARHPTECRWRWAENDK